jgi:hypothetical protein
LIGSNRVLDGVNCNLGCIVKRSRNASLAGFISEQVRPLPLIKTLTYCLVISVPTHHPPDVALTMLALADCFDDV